MKSRRYLSIRWKLLFPYILIAVLVLAVLLPVTITLIKSRFEQEADRRLSQYAKTVTALLEQYEEEALLSANFVGQLSEVEATVDDRAALGQELTDRREELDLQELSLYTPDFEPGAAPFFYGGPVVSRRLQVSQNTQQIRDNLILKVLDSHIPASGIAISPQASQIIGVAPVWSGGDVTGVVMAVIYLNNEFIGQMNQVLGIDIAIVKDNAVIVSSMDEGMELEGHINGGLVDSSGKASAINVEYAEMQERLMAYPLVLNGNSQGSVLVSLPLTDLLKIQSDVQRGLFAFAGLVVVISAVFGMLTIYSISRPLSLMAGVTNEVSAGNLNRRVRVSHLFMRDEITELSENFNTMIARLQDLYTGLEERIQERTRELLKERNRLNEILRELEQARDEALAANRSKSVFLANMSHELRTPLNAIIGYSNLVISGTYGVITEKQHDRLQRVVDNGYHLLNLINDILDLSKVEAGKMEVYLETFETEHMLDNVISTARPLAAKNSNTLVTDFAADLGNMHADLTKVRQILFNLLSNAAKFTDQGTITLSARRDSFDGKDWLHFTVEDTGIGITPEQMARLFQQFSQADSSTTRKYGGTGLGLALSRQFCQMMGGEISASSEMGKGSSFMITIPAQVMPIDIHLEAAPASDAQPNNDTVLVIDDDATARELIEQYLSDAGFKVVTAAKGEEGLRLARELKPAVITLDVMMANMDGWAVLTSLKGDPEVANIPVVMLTIVDDKNMGYALGASDYLNKPIDRERLVDLMTKYRQQGEAHVMIVEDDPSTRRMMSDLLMEDGWEVTEAENGRVALERLATTTPSIILLDLMMPEMDGFEFIETIRRDDDLKDIPVIVLTAMNLSIDDRLRLDGYIRKVLQKANTSPDVILQEVRELVQLRKPVVH